MLAAYQACVVLKYKAVVITKGTQNSGGDETIEYLIWSPYSRPDSDIGSFHV